MWLVRSNVPLFNNLTKSPLCPRLASIGVTRDLSRSVCFGQMRPQLRRTRAIDWDGSSLSQWDPTSRSPTYDGNEDTPCDETRESDMSDGWVDGNNASNASQTEISRVRLSC